MEMFDLFSYEVNVYASENPNRLETHVDISYQNKLLTFNTGLFVDQRTFKNYNRGVYSIEPVFYAFDKIYQFNMNWINIILYDYYTLSLLSPKDNHAELARKKIISDIAILNTFNSFNYSLSTYLLDIYADYDTITGPYYDEYSNYHRLLDCLIHFQYQKKELLLKESTNKLLLIEMIKNFRIESTRYDLSKEFKVFLKWVVDNQIQLINQQDLKWVLDI